MSDYFIIPKILVIVLNEADSLTREAQQALRRTMEKYMSNLRIFLVANHLGKIIKPLQSRCFLVRLPSPEPAKIVSLLRDIAAKEGFCVPNDLLDRINAYAGGNLRKAILCLEATKAKKYPFQESGNLIEKSDWEDHIYQLAMYILQEQTPQRLLSVREKLYELLTHCIPASTIFKTLALHLIENIEPQMKIPIMREAAFFEHRLTQGTKAIFHLEAFVAKFMSLYKRYLLNLAA
jgi:replication factor C subunit 3/5